MIRITLDENSCSQLGDLSEPVELCDPSGRVLARAIPVVDISEFEAVTPAVSDEELSRRSAAPGPRYTTQDVLNRLEQP